MARLYCVGNAKTFFNMKSSLPKRYQEFVEFGESVIGHTVDNHPCVVVKIGEADVVLSDKTGNYTLFDNIETVRQIDELIKRNLEFKLHRRKATK